MARDTRQREKEEAEARKTERADPSKTYELNLACVKKPQLPLLEKTLAMTKPAPRSYSPAEAALDESEEEDPAKNSTPKREALNILSDLIELSESLR